MDDLNEGTGDKIYRILLLTHVSADNLGDQTIEICSNALVQAAMNNLGIGSTQYEIISRDASSVNKRYLAMQEECQEKVTEELIQGVDLVIFGGAPMFNYKYEGFAERTARTLDIIRKYSKPVIFSAIGVEDYEADNLKCLRLKEALRKSCVKMITTRDNIEALQKFTEGTHIPTAQVADPAVFSSEVFVNYHDMSKIQKKKIGLFVIREGAFKDNRIPFGREQSIQLWRELADVFEKRGYDYEFLTSGHFYDETFLHRLTLEYGLKREKCVLYMNTPEDLIEKLSSYAGVVTCRLHPSIIAYSLKVPSVGLVWNNKVKGFYESIGYPERIISVENMEADFIADRLEEAINDGVQRDPDFLMSNYRYLFDAIKNTFCPSENMVPYSYPELISHLPQYTGSDLESKMANKFSRIYVGFNSNSDTKSRYIKQAKELKKKLEVLQDKYNELLVDKKLQFKIFYNIGKVCNTVEDHLNANYNEKIGKVLVRTKSIELLPAQNIIENNGTYKCMDNIFSFKGLRFKGWRLRAMINDKQFLMLEDGTYVERKDYDLKKCGPFRLFKPHEGIPIIQLDKVNVIVFEAVWEKGEEACG